MKNTNETGSRNKAPATMQETDTDKKQGQQRPDHGEVGGPRGLEPTRYGDWEKGGRCIDF